MTYSLALHTPESPVKEEWEWATDLMTSYDGTEDRTPLRRYPRRAISGNYSFARSDDLRRHLALAFRRFGGRFKVPLYQYGVILKAPAEALDTSVAVNALRSDFREGRRALIVEGDTFEELVVDTVAADAVTFTTGLVHDYTRRALLVPVTEAYTATGATVSRTPGDEGGSATFRYMEEAPWAPFVSPLNDTSLTMFDGKAVLDYRAMGTSFEQTEDTGIRITDYLNLPDFFSPWTQAQWAFPVVFRANRVLDLDAWLWWYAFADHVQGSAIPFLFPTGRADLPVINPAVGGGNGVTVKGDEYSQHYYGLDTFKRIVVTSDAGTHYAMVTGISSVSGNDRLTFSPALPAGAGWTSNQTVSYLLKVRIADDKITCDHYGLHTEVSLSLRTVK